MSPAIKKLPPEIRTARKQLRVKGWTITWAAEEFGVTREHLSLVLNAHRKSQRLLRKIASLPDHPDAA